MLKTKCKCKILFASATFHNQDDLSISLLLFDDKLQQLYNIYKEQNYNIESSENVSSLQEDVIIELTLTVEATLS